MGSAVRTLLLFDGLGGLNKNVVPALRGQYASGENAAYYQVVFRTLDATCTYLDIAGDAVPDGSALRRWLEPFPGGPEDMPRNSVVAGLCAYVHQASQIQLVQHRVGGVVGSLGHSLGLLGAIVAGLRLRRMDEFLEVVATCLRLVVVVLARCHQLTAVADQPGDGVIARYQARFPRGAAPGPMAALSGLPRGELSAAVRQFNEDGNRSLSVSGTNSSHAHVLSGPTAELLDFYFAHESAFARSGATWSFLTSTSPFHSPHLAPVVPRVNEDRDFIGRLPDDLRVPVYATDGPRNLQGSADLVDEFIQQTLLRPIEWELATQHAVADAAVDCIVDCGPGAAARRFAKECLRGGERSVRFLTIQQFLARS